MYSPPPPVVYYIHTDQLGTPQKVTDGSANVVWDGVFDPFGNAVASTGANWGTGLWGGFTWEPASPETMLLRFPGQYADAETAPNQNWYRDYDPTTGRYIESDPIGLSGGINTYSYVINNPLTYIDRNGLSPAVTPKAKALICRIAQICNYDLQCIWSKVHVIRQSNPPTSWDDSTNRDAENWAWAASRGPYGWQIYLYQYSKLAPLGRKTTPFSQEALDAGLEGVTHYNQSPKDLKKWCNDCGE